MAGLPYFFLTFIACMVGAVSGLGGGIIIKPVMDAVGTYSIGTINALSSITILTMTSVSLYKARKNSGGVSLRMVFTVSLGGIAGGVLGNALFSSFVSGLSNNMATTIQAGMLIFLLGSVIAEELNRDKLPHYQWDSTPFLFAMGVLTGTIGAFLGIGGGLINKPLLVLVVGLSSKSAAYGSLSIIFFSQLSHVVAMGVENGFADVEVTILPYMMIGAVVGGFVGAKIATTIDNEKFDKFFLGTLTLILLLNGVNLVRSFFFVG